MKDYKVELKVKNGYLHSMMDMHGIRTVSELSRESGVTQSSLAEISNLKTTAFNANGELRRSVDGLCKYFCCEVYDLFPPQHINSPLEKSAFIAYTNRNQLAQVEQMAADPYMLVSDSEVEFNDIIDAESVTPREKVILKMVFEQGMTKRAVALKFNISGNRVRQILAKAIRKLKHPVNKKRISNLYTEDV